MAKKQRNKINYDKAAKLWEQGKTYEQMAAALGVRGKERKDPFKPMRAIISNMLNGKATAWKDWKGNVKTLQPRQGMRAIGKGKKAPKPKAQKQHRSPKKARVHKPNVPLLRKLGVLKSKPALDGKQLAAGEKE